MVLADMYSTGEGVKPDRVEAFMLLFRATQMRINGARTKANELLDRLSASEIKQVEKKLRDMHIDPKKVFEIVKSTPHS